MSDQVTKILIRKGTYQEKNSVTLSEAELGYTTDQKRVFAGDGVNLGGSVAGNIYQGEVSLTTQINQLQYAEKGDFLLNTDNNFFYVLSGTDNSLTSSYAKIIYNSGTVTRIDAGTGLIFNYSDTFITDTGTINIKVDNSKRNIITNSSNGILGDYDVLYPVGSVILTQNNVNPSASGGLLDGAGQVWLEGGTITTNLSTVLYSWIRTG